VYFVWVFMITLYRDKKVVGVFVRFRAPLRGYRIGSVIDAFHPLDASGTIGGSARGGALRSSAMRCRGFY
jgi:hypothetical protein